MSLLTPEQQQLIQNCARDEASYTRLIELFEQQNARLSQSLREQEAQYRAVVDQQTELVCRYLPDTTLTFVNEAYCRFYQKRAEDLIGKSYMLVLDESARADVQRSVQHYLENPDVRIYENVARRHDGAQRWIQWVRSPILNNQDEVIEVQSVGRDITDLKQAEQALSRSEARYRRLIEATPDGVMITHQTVVRYANPALVKLLGGKTTEDVVGKTVFDLLHPDYHDLVNERIEVMGHDQEDASRRRERYVRLDGTTIHVEVSITPIELDEQPASLIFLHDITRRVQMEEELRQFQDQLRGLHRLGIDLSKAETFDDFCRMAVEKGRERLGIDRLGLWFLNEARTHIVGSYGTDGSGQTVDEHGSTYVVDDRFAGTYFNENHYLSYTDHTNLIDQKGKVLGSGWNALTALWDGSEVIGFLSADNLLHQRPTSPNELELLVLYGATLGHLASRIRAEEALRASEESERLFQHQLRALHQVNMELTQTESFDDLCRRAVELAHSHLGFDRIGLWFTDWQNPVRMRGSFGIDEHGNLRDERGMQLRVPEESGTLTEEIIRGQRVSGMIEDADLYNERHQVVGKGWLAAAALLDGEQAIGCLSVDNLINRQPPGRYTMELLRLYGAALGHLAVRRWAEDARLQSEKRYRAIFTGAGVGICIVNGHGYPVSSNPAFQELLGYNDDELRRIPFFEFTHPDDRPSNHDLFGRLISGSLSRYQHEKRYLLKNGQIHWVRTHVSLFPVSEGDEPLIIAVVEDIHEQKLAEANLRESEARNRVLREAIPDLIFLYDERGRFVDYHSPSDAQLLLPPSQFLNRPMQEVLPAELYALTRPHFEAALKTGKNQVFEYTLPVNGETRYYESRMIPYSEGVLSIVRDITERKQMERNNLELGLQRERIRLISDFIRDASHQFRTPLSVINSKVYLVGKIDKPELREAQLRGIQEQSDNILKLVESLVAMSRLDSDTALNLVPLQMNQLLQALYTRHETSVRAKQIRLELEISGTLPMVQADVDEIYNAFSHLLENATSYTNEGGCITIRARAVGETWLAVEIEDSGQGIEAAEMPYIFDRFFRGQIAFSTPGFGLGLAMVKKIVERHSGYIEVKSEPGKSTTFTVLLPAYQPEPVMENG